MGQEDVWGQKEDRDIRPRFIHRLLAPAAGFYLRTPWGPNSATASLRVRMLGSCFFCILGPSNQDLPLTCSTDICTSGYGIRWGSIYLLTLCLFPEPTG